MPVEGLLSINEQGKSAHLKKISILEKLNARVEKKT
jgi:hypothetical protein